MKLTFVGRGGAFATIREGNSNMIFESESGSRISIAAGTLDSSFGLKLPAHIFVEEAGSYYDISDDAVQVIGGQHDIHMPQR